MSDQLPEGWEVNDAVWRRRYEMCSDAAIDVREYTSRDGRKQVQIAARLQNGNPEDAVLLARRLTEAAAIARSWDAAPSQRGE